MIYNVSYIMDNLENLTKPNKSILSYNRSTHIYYTTLKNTYFSLMTFIQCILYLVTIFQSHDIHTVHSIFSNRISVT